MNKFPIYLPLLRLVFQYNLCRTFRIELDLCVVSRCSNDGIDECLQMLLLSQLWPLAVLYYNARA